MIRFFMGTSTLDLSGGNRFSPNRSYPFLWRLNAFETSFPSHFIYGWGDLFSVARTVTSAEQSWLHAGRCYIPRVLHLGRVGTCLMT